MAYGATMTTIANLMKEVWLPELKSWLNISTPLYAQLERSSDGYAGEAFIVPILSAINEGVGFGAENADLPDAGNNEYQQATVQPKYCRGRLQINVVTMERCKQGAPAAADAMEREVQGLKDSLRRMMGRIYFGDSSGKLCQINGAVTGTTAIVVDHGTTAADGTKDRIRKNMKLDIYLSTVRQAEAIQVASVTDGQNFVAAQNVTCTTDAWVYRHDAKDQEAMGLAGIVAGSGALQGLNPATAGQEDWKSYTHVVGAAPTELVLMESAQGIEDLCGHLPDLILTTNGVLRGYWNQLQTGIHREPIVLKGGYSAIQIIIDGKNIPILTDRNCPASTAYMLTMGDLKLKRLSDFQWLDQDGAMLSRVPDKAAYEATMFVHENLAAYNRNSHGLLTTITES